ncbi:MAG: PorV/PorQ family protein [Ignavibacteriae bacterium]|nr:MAG: PorV/PorQ family protein [Ignavibacteriota bacterium]
MRYPLVFVLLFFPSLLCAQGSSRGAVNLLFPKTPFAAATGESFVVDPSGLQSIYMNPANLADRHSTGVFFSHTEWIQDIRTECLSIAAPSSLGVFSLSVDNTSIDGIEFRTVPGPAAGTFASQFTSFQLTYGVEVTRNLSIGIAPKYLYEKIFVDESTGYGLDAGIIYSTPMEGLRLGCSLTNMGSLSAFRNDRIDLPSQIRFGGTYAFDWDVMVFRVATTFSSGFGSSVNSTSVGGEATYDRALTLRLGYLSGIDTRGFSAGIGIRYSVIMIDYAYIPFSLQVGNSHLISIGLDF